MPALNEQLSPAGPLARVLGPAFEPRPQQVEMAAAVALALEQRATLMVEAGTGVGKSFAYLIPAIARIIATAGAERVVIATNTIALQEQLLNKDIPLMRRMFASETGDAPFNAELVKGRGNYLSLRRLQMASESQEKLFLDEPARRSLHVIEDWAYATSDGTLATLPPLERAGIWDRVQSDSGNCMGKKCPTYDKCFYQSARRRMEAANLLICNHAVFFSDLALRASGEGARGFLPEYHHVILDEAHQVEEVASEHFGRSLTEGRIRHLLAALWQSKRNRGYLATLRVTGEGAPSVERAITLADAASDAADHFFESLLHFTGGEVAATRIPRKRESDEPIVPNTLSPAFRELAIALRRLKDSLLIDEDKYELNSYALRAASIADDAESLLNQHTPGCAYWIEVTAGEAGAAPRAGRIRIELACSPIEVAPLLKQHLFTGNFSVILTSATLTTASPPAPSTSAQLDPDFDPDITPHQPQAASRKPFAYALSQLGCDEARTLALGSPFDHAAQVELHADASMPDPRHPRYLDELTARIEHHIAATDGGAFVLFTSFKAMHDSARRLRPNLEARKMPVWVQGLDGPRSHILEQFRRNERSVLLGTTSFWQGVDVPGRALRNVIITRLPFDPPDRPLTQARNELIESRGGNPFMQDSLPRAVLRFKQGFGRLIRSATDKGRVVVLDPRILTARYGKAFLNALPEGIELIRH
ncbi:MAG: DEAD/DEAH box helicase [Phycisphaerae bacterium]|nr:DEAD/DEAH box helicase [Phycisphaerae bacterium]